MWIVQSGRLAAGLILSSPEDAAIRVLRAQWGPIVTLSALRHSGPSREAGAVSEPSGPPRESLVGSLTEIVNYRYSERSLATEVQESLDQYTHRFKSDMHA